MLWKCVEVCVGYNVGCFGDNTAINLVD